MCFQFIFCHLIQTKTRQTKLHNLPLYLVYFAGYIYIYTHNIQGRIGHTGKAGIVQCGRLIFKPPENNSNYKFKYNLTNYCSDAINNNIISIILQFTIYTIVSWSLCMIILGVKKDISVIKNSICFLFFYSYNIYIIKIDTKNS